MTSKNSIKSQTELKQGPKSEDLDMIANFMDNILNNMKSHIQNIQKNKSDSFQIKSEFQNFLNATQKGISDISEISNHPEKSPIIPVSPKNTEPTSPNKKQQNKSLQNKNPQIIQKMNSTKKCMPLAAQNTQKKNVLKKNVIKPNNTKIVQNSNMKQNSTIKRNLKNLPVQQNTSPRKMLVVYRENDKFVSRSLTTMLKQSIMPRITTTVNLINRATTSSVYGRNIQSRSHTSSITGNISAKSHISRSRNIAKAVNTIYNPLQQTTANTIRSKSISSNISRNTGSTLRSGITKKKPSLYITPKELMDKQIHRSNHMLRPLSMNSERTYRNNNINPTRPLSLNLKSNQVKNKSPGTPNRNIPHQNVSKRPAEQNKAQNDIKKPQNSKQIELINRINFQNGKKSIDLIKPIQILPSEKSRSASLNSNPVVKPISINQKCVSKPGTPIKFMKNNENKKIQNIVTNGAQPTKTDIENTKEPLEAKENKTDTEEQKVSSTKLYAMGDNSVTLINDKIQDNMNKIKEEKELIDQTTILTPDLRDEESCLPESQNNTSNTKPAITVNLGIPKAIIPIKPIAQNNNRQNVNNNNNNRIYINKSQQHSRQNINNQHKRISSVIIKPPIIKRTHANSTSLIPRNANIICIPPNRKLSVLTPMEIVQDFVNLVNRAKRDRKTFTVCGNYYSIRRAFAERGWVEKMRINLIDDKESWRKLESLSNFELVEGIKDRENGDKYRRIFISKLLAGHQVDFYWDYMTNPFTVNNDKIKRTLINRFPFGASRSYTSKAGLSESLKDAYWYYIEGYSNILFPRTYNLVYDEEIHSFVEDFRRTAIISLLQWISKRAEQPTSIISPTGQVPTSVFNFATLQCYNLIKSKEHKDIDEIIPMAREYEWDIFLEKFYKIVHQGNHFKETQNITAPLLIDQARYILNKIRKFMPEVDYDGNMNLWLLKPNNGSRGSGIHVCRTLRYTLDTIHSRKDTKYVIQKYLERPLLIHNTKFDIRQWFLITCMPNFQVWLYKDCYLRFSSQMYDLSKLHESIHLTNNSIQCRYRNNSNRSNDLPEQNMWHSDSFRRYLSDIGQPYAWRNTIYKGIKECLTGLFMLCQEKLLTRVNSFELCGADFMLAEDYRPYLIEINSRPALYPSTRVTAKMCPKVLEDVVKVTIDYARNPRAPTGSFELIYKDTFNYIPPKNINSLLIEGISYQKYADEKKPVQPKVTEKLNIKEIDDNSGTIQKILKIDPNKVRKDVKNTLEKILAIIHSEQHRTGTDKTTTEKSQQFRMMLSEFVDIISCVKNKSDMQ